MSIRKDVKCAIMTKSLKEHIFVVDDDVNWGRVVAEHLKSLQFECTRFEKVDDCIGQLNCRRCDLIIADLKMPGKGGMELLADIKRATPWIPVLVISAYGDISLAVKAIKAGAADFIEKPIKWDNFVSVVRSILSRNTPAGSPGSKHLTTTERIVLRLILQNKSNKEIAHILSRSIRTIEVHRSHIMSKLGVDSVVELVKKTASIGWVK